MAFVFANRGLYTLINSAVSGSTDIRQGVLTNAGSALTASAIRDMNTVADVLAAGTEAAATNYARQDLAGVTVAEDDSGDKVTLVATAATIASVGVGEVWRQTFFYVENTTDATRILIGVDTPAATLTTNGGNVTLPQLNADVTNP